MSLIVDNPLIEVGLERNICVNHGAISQHISFLASLCQGVKKGAFESLDRGSEVMTSS